MKDYFYFSGKSSADFNCYVAEKNLFSGGKKRVEVFTVPGRTGTLSLSDGSFENIPITYSMYINGDIQNCISALKGFINTASGYQRLEDSFEPDIYQKARFSEAFEVKSSDKKRAIFSITFDCDPRKFLKKGEKKLEFESAGQIKNPTPFKALPLIRAYGTGSFTIGGTTVTISAADSYTDIDSELQEAYKGSTNCNNNITLSDGFPVFNAGTTSISMTSISKLEIIPRWWTL